jgi:hypothetical protein
MADPTRPDLAAEPWSPQYPGQAAGDRTLYQPADADKPETGASWEPAPASSHLHGWKVLTDSFSRNFLAEANGFPRGSYLLQVGFRLRSGVPGLHTSYYYAFKTEAEAEGWAAVMRSAPRPGILIPDIQASCLGYRRSR